VTANYINCLDDGRQFKSLKGRLSHLGMTPYEYRAKWGLPREYPMVAANYAKVRSDLAKSRGLGLKSAFPVLEKTATKPRKRNAKKRGTSETT